VLGVLITPTRIQNVPSKCFRGLLEREKAGRYNTENKEHTGGKNPRLQKKNLTIYWG